MRRRMAPEELAFGEALAELESIVRLSRAASSSLKRA